MQDYVAKVTEIKYLTEKVLELKTALIAPDEICFEPGQFMQFKISKDVRPYSIISSPEDKKSLTFCVELLPEGVGSQYMRGLKVGDEISMRGPLGIFTVKHLDRDICFVATGVGVAPFVSMIPEMLARGFSRNVTLLFGLRQEEDIFYFDRFSRLCSLHQNFKFIPILSQPKSHWPAEVGRVTTYLHAHYQNYQNRIFYLCGGQEMVTEARSILLKSGHNPMEIKLEIFV
jgi:ferredoxin-NADP reductase